MATAVETPTPDHQKLPYILDILPHLQFGDSKPQEMLSQALSHLPLPDAMPHLIADAAFGSWETMQNIAEWGGAATLSWNKGNTTWLWELLSTTFQPNTWRAAYHAETDSVATVHALLDSTGKLIYQQVVSSAWDAEMFDEQTEEDEEEESSMPIYTDEGLKAFKVPELRAICK